MSAVLLPQGKQQYFTAAGVPLVAGKVFTYDTGTTTPRTTWADAAQTAPNANPVILDGRGEAPIFWSGAYRVVVQDSLGNAVWTMDGVSNLGYDTDPTLRADLASTTTGSEGARLIGMKQSETGGVAFTVFTRIRKNYYLRDFGAVGDDATDDTIALMRCYAACAAAGRNMLIENGSYRYIPNNATIPLPNGLLFDQKVNVIGEDWELTKLRPDGNFAGVRVDNNSDYRHFEEFRISRKSGAGVGLDGWLLSRTNFRRIWVDGHSSHNILFRAGNGPTVENCRSQGSTGGDGFKIQSFTGTAGQSCNCVVFKGVNDFIGNAGWGFNNDVGIAHQGGLLMLQGNTLGNARINDFGSILDMYLESPGSGIELQLTVTGFRNRIGIVNGVDAGIQDATGNNVIIPLSVLAGVLSPYFGPGRVGAGIAGRDGNFSGGGGGAGGAGTAGGRGFFTGGDAGGSTLAPGGDFIARGGGGANGGAIGKIDLSGGAVTNSDVDLTYSASMTPDTSRYNGFRVPATNGVAFQVNNPTVMPPRGVWVWLTIRNASGGALGALTLDTGYRASAWTQPANGFSRAVGFQSNGSLLIEKFRTTVDIPN